MNALESGNMDNATKYLGDIACLNKDYYKFRHRVAATEEYNRGVASFDALQKICIQPLGTVRRYLKNHQMNKVVSLYESYDTSNPEKSRFVGGFKTHYICSSERKNRQTQLFECNINHTKKSMFYVFIYHQNQKT